MSLSLNRTARARKTIQHKGQRIMNPWREAVGLSKVKAVDVYFDNIEHYLLQVLEKWAAGRVVVGCVAWLSNPRIIKALSRCKYLLLAVNDQDYARWGNGIAQKLYPSLPMSAFSPRDMFGHLDTPLSFMTDGNYPPVWALGEGHGNALMHSKYLVFFDTVHCSESNNSVASLKLEPCAVWTGSFNFTKNATCNIENAQFIQDDRVARAYFNDFADVFKVARPLRFEESPPAEGDRQQKSAAMIQTIYTTQ